MEAPAYLSGQLLLALPGIGDPRFERAVIAICAHDDNGALVGIHSTRTELDEKRGVVPVTVREAADARRALLA